MTLGKRLQEFYETTSPSHRARIATIVESPPHWLAVQNAAGTGNDQQATLALRNLRELFDERKAANPIRSSVNLFRLAGMLGVDRSEVFLGLLEDAA